jgi:hypothetical protein
LECGSRRAVAGRSLFVFWKEKKKSKAAATATLHIFTAILSPKSREQRADAPLASIERDRNTMHD